MILFLIWLYSLDIARWFLSSLNIIWTINKKPNTVYLTIDDVVNPDSFEEILDVFDKFNVKATFFVISSYVTESNKKLLTRSVKSGHRLANHGQRNKMHALYSDIKLLEEIEECDNLIKQIYLENNIEIPKEKFFRPGCGITTKTIEKVCSMLDYKIVLGSVYPSDTKLPFPNILAWYIIFKTKPNDIIILHDRPHCPSTLKNILPYLKEKFVLDVL